MMKLYNKAKNDIWIESEVCMSVIARYGTGGGNVPIVLESNQNHARAENTEVCPCLPASMGLGGGYVPMIVEGEKEREVIAEESNRTSIVRRLTPKECERLQGLPDDWSRYGINENGETYELPDSARYRLQGNGIATPFWRWMLKRISAQYERTPTLGSLFDGQASFPMIWEGINGEGTALWSSEIDKHAIAVAKYHFPEEEESCQT